MPEILEVDVLRRCLSKSVAGKTLVGVTVTKPLRQSLQVEEDFQPFIGQPLISIDRWAKHLYFFFGKETVINSQLGLTGWWTVQPRSVDRVPPHTCYSLTFDDSTTLHYHDPRKFGKLSSEHLLEKVLFPRPDVLSPKFHEDSPHLTPLSKSKKKLVTVLQDQTYFPGVGAYLGAETMFAAKLHPATPVGLIWGSQEVKARLFKALQTVLSTFLCYAAAYDDKPRPFRVYGRAGEPCFDCGTEINKWMDERGSHFCMKCQSLLGKEF